MWTLSQRCAPRKSRNDAPFVQIDVSLLTDDVGVPSTDTLDFGQGVHDLALSIDVSVQQTEDVLVMMCLDRFPVLKLVVLPGIVGEPLGRRGT